MKQHVEIEMLSTIKLRHIWILYLLLAAVVLPIHGLDVLNGNVTKYVYSAGGEKLRVIYQTAVPIITVPIGSSRELARSEILYTDSTDYLLGGSLMLKNGRIDKYQFEGGYCQAEKYDATQDIFYFYYYDQDHLGSIRQVRKFVKRNIRGTLLQTMNYYPFGTQFCHSSAGYSDVQSHKYNGKEFDQMHGLNTYDYGARQYNPILARWDRVDPLAEKYYPYSPYNYCLDNPVKNIDPDGRAVETGWDIFNVGLDITSLSHNVINGNVGAAVVDGLCLVADVAATAMPFVPGGAGAAVKAARTAEKAVNATKSVGKSAEAAKMAQLRQKAEIGQEAHRQIEKELTDAFGSRTEVKVNLNDRAVRKDAQMPDGKYVIIKPDTKSGHKAAKSRQRLMEKNGKEAITIYYDPKNPAYLPGSPSYIGAKKK